jgi:salicylate hydroxylase
VAYRGAVPLAEVPHPPDLRDVTAWIGPGLHLVQYALRAGELVNTVGVFRSPAFGRHEADGGEAEWGGPDELDAAFACTAAHVRESTRLLGRAQRWAMYDRLPIRDWVRGRVALLGDAAHPMLQYLAQGACQAVEDADALARAMAAEPDDPQALLAYQHERAPRAARVQTTARAWGEFWHVDGPEREARYRLLCGRAPDDHASVAWLYGP